jgi:hypothetical protein
MMRVRKKWAEKSERATESKMAEAIATKKMIFKEAWGLGKHEVARKAHNDLCHLDGLMPEDRGGAVVEDNRVQIVFNTVTQDGNKVMEVVDDDAKEEAG